MNRALLAVAVVVFLVVGWLQTDVLGTWHEEVSVFPRPAYVLVTPEGDGGALVLETICEGGAGDVLEWSSSRPRLSLCQGGYANPIMVESYFAGVFYWPSRLLWSLHEGNPFVLRKIGLLAGALGLILGYLLVARLRDERTAAVVAMSASASSPNVVLNSLLVAYEVLPWYLLLVAALVLGPDPREASERRIKVCAAFVGLAVLANVKAVFVVAPLLVLVAWRERALLRQWGGKALAEAGLIAIAASSPLWMTALADPGGGFGNQVGVRLATVVRKLDLRTLPGELLGHITFGADVAVLLTGDTAVSWLWLVLVGSAILWSWVHAVRWVMGRDANGVGVICGVLSFVFVWVSQLLYDQHPSANYSPLFFVYPMAIGGMLTAGIERAARLFDRGETRVAPALVVASVALTVANVGVLRARAVELGDMQWPINHEAQAQFSAYLDGRDPDVPLLTSTYNLSGVPEALSPATRGVFDVHMSLHACQMGEPTEAAAIACLRGRIAETMALVDAEVVEVVVPIGSAVIDPPWSGELGRLFREVPGWRWRTVHTSRIDEERGVFEVLRGEASGADTGRDPG